jgi:hypothetical protein
MENQLPFEIIIDSYSTECASLYGVIKSLFNYPDINNIDDELEGKLYATAFAYICHDYLKTENSQRQFVEFDVFVEKMKFSKDDFSIFKKGLSSTTLNYEPLDFSELVWAIIQDYQIKIKKDIRLIFKEDDTITKLFVSIFRMGDADYFTELTMEGDDFVRENFSK